LTIIFFLGRTEKKAKDTLQADDLRDEGQGWAQELNRRFEDTLAIVD
jgi:hypothetical protein